VAGPALQRAGRYDTDHEIAVTLQRSLLTDADITIPGIDWSAQYRSGSPGVAGGDWYDVIALADDAVALAIGDIVGKGVEAAAAMGQLRSATRALAQRIRDPAELLHALDDYASTTKQGLYSSMVFAIFDPAVGALHHAVAGHPPPVLRTADGDVVVVSSGRGPLLGIDATRTTATIPMGSGDTLVLFTDGLIERRHRTLQDGLTQLCNVIGAGPSAPALLSRYIVHAMNDGKATDDIAVVSAQLTPIRGRSPVVGDPGRTSVGS
jgi:serine phosphatase RsbU (regulator of sigma subunit)